jgi:hypothetical protein
MAEVRQDNGRRNPDVTGANDSDAARLCSNGLGLARVATRVKVSGRLPTRLRASRHGGGARRPDWVQCSHREVAARRTTGSLGWFEVTRRNGRDKAIGRSARGGDFAGHVKPRRVAHVGHVPQATRTQTDRRHESSG